MQFMCLTAGLALAAAAAGQMPADASASESATSRIQFAAPTELTGGGEAFRGMIYPSPTLYDIDGDGQNELVIGDLRGFVWVSERGQDGNFAEKKQLEVDGQPLKFHNW